MAAEVAAHEVRHLAKPRSDPDSEEHDAERYGEWAAEALHSTAYGVAGNVHTCTGRPLNCLTLKGETKPGDVVLAKVDGTVKVFRVGGGVVDLREVR
jgi:hypothetical protein